MCGDLGKDQDKRNEGTTEVWNKWNTRGSTNQRGKSEKTELTGFTTRDQPSSCSGGGGHKVRAVQRSQGGPTIMLEGGGMRRKVRMEGDPKNLASRKIR